MCALKIGCPAVVATVIIDDILIVDMIDTMYIDTAVAVSLPHEYVVSCGIVSGLPQDRNHEYVVDERACKDVAGRYLQRPCSRLAPSSPPITRRPDADLISPGPTRTDPGHSTIDIQDTYYCASCLNIHREKKNVMLADSRN